MNYQELKKKIEEIGLKFVISQTENKYIDEDDLDQIYDESLHGDDLDEFYKTKSAELKKEIADLNVTIVNSVGGHSGAGDRAERVLSHQNGDEFIYAKVSGWYSSYEGCEWHKVEEVFPIVRSVTFYEKR